MGQSDIWITRVLLNVSVMNYSVVYCVQFASFSMPSEASAIVKATT